MPQPNDKVPLTTFVDFVSKSGTPKLTVVRKFKHRPPYDPATDFYKPLRDEVVRIHQKGESKKALDAFVSNSHAKKQANYAAVVAGYKKFLGAKAVSWFAPPTATWDAGPITVSVNPELGLEIGGTKYVIKLYFKGEKLSLNKTEVVNHLMNVTLASSKVPMTFGVLDMRNGKLYTTKADPALAALLHGEAAAFRAMLAAV